jgi:ATP-binding protein involved in chromosome partitioning
VAAHPDSEAARLYRDIAHKLAVKVASKAKDFSARFPTITVSRET